MSESLHRLEEVVAAQLRVSEVASLLVGVSGGADSVALLHALIKSGGCRVHAVHCNFHLRGDESMRDENFVRTLCAELEVPLTVVDFDVDDYRKRHGGSVEMACRDLRYAEFKRLAAELDLQRVAVAHNLDDNVETFFLNLMRGAGSAGLDGMVADNGFVLRPMLGVSRKEIEGYLAQIRQNYITDSSNLSDDFNRNFIRNKVVPLLTSRWKGAKESVAKSQKVLADENNLVDAVVASQISDSVRFLTRDARYLSVSPVTFFFRFIKPFGGTSAIADEMAATLNSGFNSRIWKLSSGFYVAEERGGWRITKEPDEAGNYDGNEFGNRFEWVQVEMNSDVWKEMCSDRSNQCFRTCCSPDEYYFRNPKKGDRMTVFGMKGSALLSDVLKDAHVPAYKRMQIPLLARRDTEAVAWIPGIKRSALDTVKKNDEFVWCLRPKQL